jgi:hypothetical protein
MKTFVGSRENHKAPAISTVQLGTGNQHSIISAYNPMRQTTCLQQSAHSSSSLATDSVPAAERSERAPIAPANRGIMTARARRPSNRTATQSKQQDAAGTVARTESARGI